VSKKVAVIICNWNRKDYVVNCIRSVLESSFKDYDLYMVDNASTDGSVEAVRETFGDKVILIENPENRGGSGGFNRGMSEALKESYKYLYLLDNDVVLDKNALSELYGYMEQNPDVGMAGSLIYVMHNPQQIQELGAVIDWDKYFVKPYYKGEYDRGQLPEYQECDYVPACSALVRVSAIKKVGLMPEENFIYWDDMEWGYKFKLNGYRVVAIQSSKVWHRTGGAGNTFIDYYYLRNRIRFFAKYLSKEKLVEFAKTLLDTVMRAMYCSYLKNKTHSIRTMLGAIDDALSNVTGKAVEGRIFPSQPEEYKVQNLLADKKRIIIIEPNLDDVNSRMIVLECIIKKLMSIKEGLEIIGAVSDVIASEANKDLNFRLIDKNEINNIDCDLIFQSTEHILSNINELNMDYVWIDCYLNMICDEKDYYAIKGFQHFYQIIMTFILPIFMEKLLKLRSVLLNSD